MFLFVLPSLISFFDINYIKYLTVTTQLKEHSHWNDKQFNKDLEIIVEARNLDEVKQILKQGGIKRILLDNFDYKTTKKAVEIIRGKCQSESSGGITEDTITEYAKCGVDFISVGALTHSVLNFDLSLKAI